MYFKKLITKKRAVIGVLILAVLAVIFFWQKNGNHEGQTLVLESKDFIQQVSVSGKVIPGERVDLTFEEAGRVSNIFVDVGSRVKKGDSLISLDLGTLIAELQSAEANLQSTLAGIGNTKTSFDEVKKQHDTLVANAYRNLLSEDLVAVPRFSDYNLESPEISGFYNGSEEGTYRIRIEFGYKGSTDKYTLRTNGLEQVEPVLISADEPTPIGTRGLLVSFPENISSYNDTTWEISVPNVKGESYLTNWNAYTAALRSRDKAISDAEQTLASGASEADILSAQAEVNRIKTQIALRTLRAPFDGIITMRKAEVGSIASPSVPVIAMISEDLLQIESYVPEINIPLVKVGDMAIVTLDAYGSDAIFPAKVLSIDPAETVRDGVSTYRVILQFESNDPRIKSGMTANIVITTAEKSDVLSVPQGIVITRNGKKYVPVKVGDVVEEREVAVGEVSSFGEIEILSGLFEGDVVILDRQ